MIPSFLFLLAMLYLAMARSFFFTGLALPGGGLGPSDEKFLFLGHWHQASHPRRLLQWSIPWALQVSTIPNCPKQFIYYLDTVKKSLREIVRPYRWGTGIDRNAR